MKRIEENGENIFPNSDNKGEVASTSAETKI